MTNPRQEQSISLRVVFERSPKDPPQSSGEYQASISEVLEQLRRAGVKATPRMRFNDSANGPGSFTGEIALVASVIPPLSSILTSWLSARSGRKLRLKIEDVEVEANTKNDLEWLLNKAQILKKKEAQDGTDK